MSAAGCEAIAAPQRCVKFAGRQGAGRFHSSRSYGAAMYPPSAQSYIDQGNRDLCREIHGSSHIRQRIKLRVPTNSPTDA